MNKGLSKIWRKHTATLIIIVTLTILIGMGASSWAAKDRALLTLVDIEGDREVLSDVTVSGELRDRLHRMSFELSPDGLSKQTSILGHPGWSQAELAGSQNGFIGLDIKLGAYSYYIYNTFNNYQISASALGYTYKSSVGQTLEIQPSLRYHRSPDEGDGISYTNSLQYGLAISDDVIYFTVPASTQFSGESPIYELKFIPSGTPTTGVGVDLKPYLPREVTHVSLDRNENQKESGLAVLGMEGLSGGKLALFVADNDQLKVRGYDAITGALLGELAVPDIYFSESAAIQAGGSNYYSMNYEAHYDEGQSLLTVVFRKSIAGGSEFAALTLDLTDGVKLVNEARITFKDGIEMFNEGISSYTYVNNQLYVLKSFYRDLEDDQSPLPQALYPKRLMMYAYEGDVLKYKGEWLSDENDDFLLVQNSRQLYRGYSYDLSNHRVFTNVQVRPYVNGGVGK